MWEHLLIAFFIFIARIIDVTIGTIKIIFISRGYKIVAPFLAFAEIMVWLVAIRQIMINLDNPICFLGYALGFACGTFSGLKIEEKLAAGILMVRIITKTKAKKLPAVLKEHGYAYTNIEARGSYGKVNIIFSVIKRRCLKEFIKLIKETNPQSFYSVEDVRLVGNNGGVIPNISNDSSFIFKVNNLFKFGKTR